MKSPMVEQADFIEDKEAYSDLQVLRSGAGYYIGTIHRNTEFGEDNAFNEPGSRDTGYFATRKEAEDELKNIEAGNPTAPLRMEP